MRSRFKKNKISNVRCNKYIMYIIFWLHLTCKIRKRTLVFNFNLWVLQKYATYFINNKDKVMTLKLKVQSYILYV